MISVESQKKITPQPPYQPLGWSYRYHICRHENVTVNSRMTQSNLFSSGPLPGVFGSLQRACPPGGTPSQLGSLHRARPHREGTHKHLKTSGLEKQSTQLCEVHQWQSEQAAVAARALPDFSAVQNSPVFDRNRKDEGRFGRSKELNHKSSLPGGVLGLTSCKDLCSD